MDRCRFIRELGGYLDNQLPEKRKAEIEDHLKHCVFCIQESEKLKALSQRLKSWPAPVLDASFDSSVRSKIVALELAKETDKMKSKTLSILIPSGALVGIMIVSLLSLNVYMKSGIQGKLKSGYADIGNQYEPYYAESEYHNRQGAKNAVDQDKRSENMRHNGERKSPQPVKESIDYSISYSDGGGKTRSGGAYSDQKRLELAKQDSSASISFERMPAETVQSNTRVDNINHLAEDSRVIVIQPVLPATGVGDMIIRTAELTLEVENGKQAHKKIADICREFEGYQAESSFSRDSQGRESGRVTLRIPKDKFLLALEKLSELGKVKANNTNSQDVSQDYANLKAELDAAKVVYDKMLEALQRRQTGIPEAVRLESELTPVLKKIENLKNQVEKLNNLTSFTTISVNFYEAEVSPKVLEETRKLVKESMLAAKINAVRYFAAHLPLVGLAGGVIVTVLVFVVLILIVISHLKKRG